jgi:hypothetical protein
LIPLHPRVEYRRRPAQFVLSACANAGVATTAETMLAVTSACLIFNSSSEFRAPDTAASGSSLSVDALRRRRTARKLRDDFDGRRAATTPAARPTDGGRRA